MLTYLHLFTIGPSWHDLETAILSKKSLATITSLLDRGAPIVSQDKKESALIEAARTSKDVVSLLLDRGADVNFVDGHYGTALAVAAYNGATDTVSLLLNRGANVNMVGGVYGTALVAAAFKGATDTVLLLLDRGADVNMVGEHGTALAAAVTAYRGVTNTVLLLLDRGADVNMVGGKYGTALVAAALEGDTKTVSLLLDRGANVNMVDGMYGTALTVAAFNGVTGTVSLLLDWGADVNMVGGKYGTALAAAALHGIPHRISAIVSLLLDRGADVNMVGGEYGTALAAAAYNGATDTVSLLLDQGADVNMVGGVYGTVLAAAAFKGFRDPVSNTRANVNIVEGAMKTVSMLLDRGADVNMVGGMYGTALAAAAFQGASDTVSLLLGRGANVNMVGGEYGTALVAAASKGATKTVSLLLDRRADVNMVGGMYGTALAAAAFHGATDTVSLLLDRRANVNMVGGEYGTALAAAAYNGATDTVSLLLDRGADVNKVGGVYGTALAAAAFKGFRDPVSNTRADVNIVAGATDTVSMLLDRGANINMVGGVYGTALAAAAFQGATDTVLLLLDRGANVNMVGGEYGTALAAAAFKEATKTVSLLLDRGADVNMVGGEYGTALVAAAFKGATDTVLLLLDRGADVNMVGEHGTALAAAAGATDAQLLLGADVSVLSGEYGDAMALALGTVNTVLLLLDRGADVNMVGGEYGTALAAAAFKGAKNKVSLLLDRGGADGEYGTALAAAISREQWNMVSMLINHGADINLVIDSRGTVLGRAIYEGSEEITSLLLERGADVTHVGGSYPTSSGVYPSALDVAHSEGSRADPTLLMLLTTETSKRNGSITNASLANNEISRPPFPMPYTRPYSTFHHRGTLPPGKTSEPYVSSNISPEQADVQVGEVHLHSLAALVGLHEDTIQAKCQWIQNDIRYFVACNYDFGLAYAAARVAWVHFNEPSVDCNVISVSRGRWHKHAQRLDDARSKAIEIGSQAQQELIASPYSIMPRRLWDLISNRVVNFRMLHASQSTNEATPTFWAVTHSWTADMSLVWTSINQHQWPVPIPKDTSLESLRSELLTLGAEYVWIDVLCLRQENKADHHLEKLRVEEWKLDVPTIGNVYRTAANIVRYFNGLGVRFCDKHWDGPRHWLQRAWTLQEIANENTTINGGIPRDEGEVFLNSSGEVLGKDQVRKVIKLRSALRPVLQLAAQLDDPYGCDLYELVQEMSRRHATQPLDKLAGLFYLLRTSKLPCYDAKKTSEDVWKQFFYLLPPQQKAQVLFHFPYRASEDQWFPTWAQVLDWPVRDPEYDHIRSWITPWTIPGEVPLFINDIWTISDATLIKAKKPSEYKVEIKSSLFGFYQPYLSQKPIDIEDNPVFTLAAKHLGHAHNWLVCIATEKYQWAGADVDLGVTEYKILKKVGILRTDTSSELLVRGLVQQSVDCLFI